MADQLELARPYAKAALAAALEDQALPQWSEALATVAAIAADKQVQALVGHPQVTQVQLADLVIDVAGQALNQKQQNLVRLLAENKRLANAPTIAEEFEQLRAKHEQRSHVTVTSAAPIAQAQQEALIKALEKKLATTVDVDFEQSEDLIGGFVVQVGDMVIDRSLRSQLTELEQAVIR